MKKGEKGGQILTFNIRLPLLESLFGVLIFGCFILQPQFFGGLMQGYAGLAGVAALCGGEFAAVFQVFQSGF